MRWLVVVHRWIGVGMCLLFATWFATGLVMLYVPFPSLSTAERLTHSPELDLASLQRPLTDALDAIDSESVDRLRLVALSSNRPAMIIERADAGTAVVYADTAQPVPSLTRDDARIVAERFAGTMVRTVSDPFDFDQWVVHQAFDRYRPYFRVDLADAAGTRLYVSQLTGEVLQRTTRSQRAWNYAGAVVHWIYPTIIRKHWALWDKLVWWLSLIGILGAVLGLTLGVVRLREARARGRRGLASPFVGWLRWHHKLGLIVGLVVTTWIASGWLSMDHGRLFSMPDPTAQQVRDFRGMSLRNALANISPAMLEQANGAREIEVLAIAGLPVVVSRFGPHTIATIKDPNSDRARQLTDADLASAIQSAWPNVEIDGIEVVRENDPYAHLREGSLGSAVQRVTLKDRTHSWIHVDLQNARIVSVMDRSRRLYRWLFNGLHSFDFPGFVDRRPLWDITMITLLLTGFAFSLTGIVIGFKRLLR